MKSNPRIKDLFAKYSSGNANQHEAEELLHYIQTSDSGDEIRQLIEQDMARADQIQTDSDITRRLSLTHQALLKQIEPEGKTRRSATKLWPYISAAAMLLFVIGTILYTNQQRMHQPDATGASLANILPGSNKAILTLSDGTSINLNDVKNGQLATMPGIRIAKTAEGQVTYTVTGKSGHSEINTIKTPRGGQYRLRLPDNTEVWLNAASTLKFPASFNGRGERSVELTGEAYFKVAKDKTHPFIVRTKDQDVKVLGTHFNINSYNDEVQTVTTLEEGSIQVKAGAEQKILRPGQQSVLNANKNLSVRKADMDVALAWTNNEMVFNNASVKEIMRQIARWYDLDIEYQGPISGEPISGTLDRKDNLADVLQLFAAMQIHFTLQETSSGKKLIIKP